MRLGMRKLFFYPLLAGILALIGLFQGCATVTRGTNDVLVVESEPAGATVLLSNGMTGKTPTSFKVPRKNPLVVKIKKEGYETLEVNVNPKMVSAGGMGMAGNVLLGGAIGAVVDGNNGSMRDLSPNPVSVKLVPISE